MKYKLFTENTDDVLYTHENTVIQEVMKKVLKRRGYVTDVEVQDFLFPSYEKWVKDPMGIMGMEKAAKRIVDALRLSQKICVYSDYDCDGIPGGAVLSDFFDYIGYQNRVHYIPHRHKEGYGMNKKSLDKLAKEGVTLIITVDNGITSHEEVLHAKSLGMDVIVSDHHLPIRDSDGVQILPEAFVVLNSKRDDCTYHDNMLCGCALAWKMSCAVLNELRKTAEVTRTGCGNNAEGNTNTKTNASVDTDTQTWNAILEKVRNTKEGWEKWWLDLVAISTVADMVPLQKENRALAYFGLKVLQKSPRAGLQKLFTLAKTKQNKLNAQDIAFTIAPRVNAASRMDDPILAFHMLRNSDDVGAMASAEKLEVLNTERKETVKEIVKEVMGYDFSKSGEVIVIGDESWTPGVLGLIAQQVMDETGKATFVWGKGEESEEEEEIALKKSKKKVKESIYKGSCRAPNGINLVQLMSDAEDGTFVGFGGHEQAGGFSVYRKEIDKLATRLSSAYETLDKENMEEGQIIIDAHITFDQVNQKLFTALDQIEPTGVGNVKPTFAFTSNGAKMIKEFGKKGGHYELLYDIADGKEGVAEGYAFRDQKVIKAIYFFANKEALKKAEKAHMLIAQLEVSHFGWKPELRLRVVDIIDVGI